MLVVFIAVVVQIAGLAGIVICTVLEGDVCLKISLC